MAVARKAFVFEPCRLRLVETRTLRTFSFNESAEGSDATDELDEVIRIVSKNPMCLRLAARLIRDEGVERLREDRSIVFARLRAEKIQALLYGRILRHMHGDEDLAKVAYPGLVVRRITPETIREVLAEPCQLELPPGREHAIFNALRQEAALVRVDAYDGSLRHRTDVRRTMLGDLTDSVAPDVIAAIDRNAVVFYENLGGGVARAEELYHRLRLGEDEAVLDARWSEEARDHLAAALEELPARQRLWLANRLQVTLDSSTRRAARQEVWEEQVARAAERLLESRAAEKALSLLSERDERRPRSPLYAVEAEAYRFLGRPDDALTVARAGVDAAIGDGGIDPALELLLKMAVIEEARDRLGAAQALVEEARGVATHSTDELLRLRVRITHLRLQRQLRPSATKERLRLREEALESLDERMLVQLRVRPVLLREVAAELGKQHPRVTGAAVEALGPEVGSDLQAEAFAEAYQVLQETPRIRLRKRMHQLPHDAAAVREWVSTDLTSADTQQLGRVLAQQSGGSEVLDKFRDYFRRGVTRSLGFSDEGGVPS